VCGPVSEHELFPSGPVIAEVVSDSGVPKAKGKAAAKQEQIVLQNDAKPLENGLVHFHVWEASLGLLISSYQLFYD